MKKKIIIAAVAVIAVIIAAVCAFSFGQADKKEPGELSASQSTQAQTEKESESAAEAQAEKSNTEKSAEKETKPQKKPAPQAKSEEKTNPAAPQTQRQTEINAPAEEKKLKVSVSISCKNALKYEEALPQSGYFAENEAFEAKEGETALDALNSICTKNNLAVEKRGNYIVSIGSLRERQCTPSSGWVYTVNGALINKPMNKYALKDGDFIEIYYVTSPSDKA